jgi:branched-subunit amino acid ABC-type transport system permease component
MLVLSTLNVVSGIALLFIIALGLAVIFGVMGVVNLAHGEFIMIGAYVAYLITNAGLPVGLSFVAAPVAVGLFALLLEPIFFRFLYGRVMESILATWGLSLALQQAFQLTFGSGYKSVPYLTESSVSVLGTGFSLYRLLVIAFALALAGIVLLIERRTYYGTLARATMSNAQLAATLGVNVSRIYAGTLVLGAGLAGLAGAVIAPLTSAYPTMGLGFLTTAFFAVLVAGLGSLSGLVFSSSALGASQNLVSILVDPVAGSVVLVVVALILVRLRRTV